jgi:hypothetical protein
MSDDNGNDILDTVVMLERQKDIDDVVFNRGKIGLYDLKTSFSMNHPPIKTLKRKKIVDRHTFEILGVCDEEERFVVHPDHKLQVTKNGGTIKILRLVKGYEIKQHVIEKKKGISGEGGVTVAGTGVKLAIDNNRLSEFSMELGKLTHEHLIMILDTHKDYHLWGIFTTPDSAEIVLDYLIIDKKDESDLVNAIRYERRRRQREKRN